MDRTYRHGSNWQGAVHRMGVDAQWPTAFVGPICLICVLLYKMGSGTWKNCQSWQTLITHTGMDQTGRVCRLRQVRMLNGCPTHSWGPFVWSVFCKVLYEQNFYYTFQEKLHSSEVRSKTSNPKVGGSNPGRIFFSKKWQARIGHWRAKNTDIQWTLATNRQWTQTFNGHWRRTDNGRGMDLMDIDDKHKCTALNTNALRPVHLTSKTCAVTHRYRIVREQIC